MMTIWSAPARFAISLDAARRSSNALPQALCTALLLVSTQQISPDSASRNVTNPAFGRFSRGGWICASTTSWRVQSFRRASEKSAHSKSDTTNIMLGLLTVRAMCSRAAAVSVDGAVWGLSSLRLERIRPKLLGPAFGCFRQCQQ